MQLETPMPTIEYVASLAAERGKRVVLNPAPAATLSEQLLKNLYLITPNETEAELITGIPVRDERSAEQAARTIHRTGVRHVVVTLGKKGALLCEGGRCEVIPAHRVEAVDTTAAGDVFNAGLVVALSEGKNLADAVRFGATAAAISVTRMGAQASAPTDSDNQTWRSMLRRRRGSFFRNPFHTRSARTGSVVESSTSRANIGTGSPGPIRRSGKLFRE